MKKKSKFSNIKKKGSKKPTFSNQDELNSPFQQFPDGGKSSQSNYIIDPLKWNQFQMWSKTQKTPTGELYVGNPKMDTSYEGGDKVDPQDLINKWNQANPTKQITNKDILAAQQYSGNLKTDQWYGSQTSQYMYPQKGGKFDFSKTPQEGQQFNITEQIGGKPYSASATWQQGKPVYGTVIPQFPLGGDFWNKTADALKDAGEFTKNAAIGYADANLTALGMSNVIQDSAYKGKGADTIRDISGKVGNVWARALPTIANVAVPGSGQFVGMGQQALNQYTNPKDKSIQPQEYSFGGGYGKKINFNDPSSPSGNMIPMGKWTLIPTYPTGGKMPCLECGGTFPNGGIYQYPYGGYPYGGNPNAEVEKKEVLQNPNGQVDQVNGPTHDNGGIKVNIPSGTQIFSDRLKHPELKKTFAKLAGKYKTDKEEKTLEDNKADLLKKRTAQLMINAKNKILDSLFEEQEQLKKDKVSNYAKKLGVELPETLEKETGESPEFESTEHENLEQMKSGGKWIQKATASIKKRGTEGVCTGSKFGGPTCRPGTRRYNLAKTFRKMAKNRAYGGVQQYPGGGIMNNGIIQYPDGGINLPVLDETGLEIQPEHLQKFPTGPKFNFNFQNLTPQQKDAIGFGADYLASNLGNIMYLKEQGKRPEVQKFYEYHPTTLSAKEPLRQADIEGKIAASNIASASGGGAGDYLSNRTALASSLSRSKAAIMENIANQNAQIVNQGQMYNIGNRYTVDDINAQNRARALQNYYSTIGALGMGAAGVHKDYRQTQMDRSMINLLPELYNNPEFVALLKKYGYTK